MMTNLFSTFDPSSTASSFPWVLLIMSSLIIPSTIWKPLNPLKTSLMKPMKTLKKEVKTSLMKGNKGMEKLNLTIILSIMIMNFSALFPQTFSLTSHLSITLPLSLSLWTAVTTMGWITNTKHMLAHLLPQGTPPALMMFMVVIELTSTIIRPITLCVRLTANLIAGHLLMTLLGNFILSMNLNSILLSSLCPLLLTVLESAVALIQAYVFMTLISLYLSETK